MHNLTSKALCRIHTHRVRKHGVHSLCLFVKVWRNNIKVWSSTNSRSDNIAKNSSRCWSSTCKCFDNSNSEKNTKLGPMWPDGGVSLCVTFRRRLGGLSSIHWRNVNIMNSFSHCSSSGRSTGNVQKKITNSQWVIKQLSRWGKWMGWFRLKKVHSSMGI